METLYTRSRRTVHWAPEFSRFSGYESATESVSESHTLPHTFPTPGDVSMRDLHLTS